VKSLLLLPLALVPATTFAEPPAATGAIHAPPAPPAILQRDRAQLRAAAPVAPAATGTLYSIGTPTDDEQYYLELINRARATPAAEGVRLATTTDADVTSAYAYFSVDLAMMQSEFAALPVRPPLALNALLTQAARGHTTDLYTNAFQGHVGTDGRTLGQRVTATGYAWNSLGENVYSYADSTWHGHAGFEVDWGGSASTGGMQSPRGHRNNIHGDFREVGIGVLNGSNTVGSSTVGPQLVTQDFGNSGQVFVTGVAYYDLDGDGFYDPGEGVGGLTVEVSGASSYAVTAASGGYAVPVPLATTTRTVTFTGPDLSRSSTVALTSGVNAKVDCTAAYQPPVVSGSVTPGVGIPSTYSFTALGGATGYEWQQVAETDFADDPADALGRVVVASTGSYAVLDTGVKYSGAGSYHLAHPTSATQLLTYPDPLLVGASATVTFRSRLGWATSYQNALLEVSQNGGATWQAIYTQAGADGAGETAFQQRTVSLAAYAGKSVRLRFAFRAGGSYYTATTAGVGWYIDQIAFANLHTLAAATTTTVPTGRSFAFTAPAAGPYLLAVRPLTPGRVWPFGPFLEVTAAPASPFSTWAAQQESIAGLPAGTIGEHPDADSNGDGVSNLTAYALGLSATTLAAPPVASVSSDRLRLVYPRDTTKTDITITPQISTDLLTWSDVGAAGAPTGFTDSLLSSAGTVQTREASVPLGSGNRLFLRLRIVRP
jgi:uncharacterized protein YkwD